MTSPVHTDAMDKNPILSSTHIDIIRHGECEGGAIFRGATDVKLLPEGLENMRKASKKFQSNWDVVISSPMQRCQEFANEIAKHRSTLLIQDERLREMHFGRWDGQEIEQVWQDYSELVNDWRENPEDTTPPEGEPLTEVFNRVEEFYREVLKNHAGKKILFVTHGGIIRVILSIVLQLPKAKVNRFEVPYACVSSISVIHTKHTLLERLHAHNF